MKPYKSKSGRSSGVSGYVAGSNFIVVRFNHTFMNKFTYDSAGRLTVEKMKSLAEAQKGLTSFIAKLNPGFE